MCEKLKRVSLYHRENSQKSKTIEGERAKLASLSSLYLHPQRIVGLNGTMCVFSFSFHLIHRIETPSPQIFRRVRILK